ncbi:MAG: exodeoxyribonuclease VII small subunit [Eubacterium sp.]
MDKEMTYEKAMSRLEEIASLLEGNEISLDDSMKLFEEGTRLTAFCSKKLKDAEQKITLLSKE